MSFTAGNGALLGMGLVSYLSPVYHRLRSWIRRRSYEYPRCRRDQLTPPGIQVRRLRRRLLRSVLLRLRSDDEQGEP